MRQRTTWIITLTVAVLLASAFAPAHANAPYLVEAAGQSSVDTGFEATSNGVIAITAGTVPLSCTPVTLGGTVLAGHSSANPAGADHVFDITDSDVVACSGMPAVSTHNGTWTVHAAGTATAPLNDTFTTSMPDFSLSLSLPGCSFTLAGTVAGEFDETTQQLTLSSPSPALTVSGVSGCYSLVQPGDPGGIEGTFDVHEPGDPSAPVPINLLQPYTVVTGSSQFEATNVGGPVTFSTPGATISCTSATLWGDVLPGSTAGNPGGAGHVIDITSSAWSGCSNGATGSQNGSWEVHISGPATSPMTDVFDAQTTGSSLTLSSPYCTVTIAGFTQGELDENTQYLSWDENSGNVVVTSVTGCFATIMVGDPVDIDGTFLIHELGNYPVPLPFNVTP